MDTALIVSGSEKGAQPLKELLLQSSFSDIHCVCGAGEAGRLLCNREYDLCLVNTPLTDEFGSRFATEIAAQGSTQILLLVKCELYDEVTNQVENCGVFTLAKPLNRQLFWSALKLVTASYNRLKGLASQNIDLQKKIEEIRLVDRAKCMLMQCLTMSEEQAHKYIERQAMDQRKTKKEVATAVLHTYDS